MSEEIINKLNELKTKLNGIKQIHHSKGEEEFNFILNLLEIMTKIIKNNKAYIDARINKYYILSPPYDLFGGNAGLYCLSGMFS